MLLLLLQLQRGLAASVGVLLTAASSAASSVTFLLAGPFRNGSKCWRGAAICLGSFGSDIPGPSVHPLLRVRVREPIIVNAPASLRFRVFPSLDSHLSRALTASEQMVLLHRRGAACFLGFPEPPMLLGGVAAFRRLAAHALAGFDCRARRSVVIDSRRPRARLLLLGAPHFPCWLKLRSSRGRHDCRRAQHAPQ